MVSLNQFFNLRYQYPVDHNPLHGTLKNYSTFKVPMFGDDISYCQNLT